MSSQRLPHVRAVPVCASPSVGHQPPLTLMALVDPVSRAATFLGRGQDPSISQGTRVPTPACRPHSQARPLCSTRLVPATAPASSQSPPPGPWKTPGFSGTSYCCFSDDPEGYFPKEFTRHNHPSVTLVPVGPGLPPLTSAPVDCPTAPLLLHLLGTSTHREPPHLRSCLVSSLQRAQCSFWSKSKTFFPSTMARPRE